MSSRIFETLHSMGLTSEGTRYLYSARTRDRENLCVWKDRLSGVVYIDGYFVGDEAYESGSYRQDEIYDAAAQDFERRMDCERRVSRYRPFFIGRSICDFGCGAGDFLRAASPACKATVGVELQADYVEFLNSESIRCVSSLDDIENKSMDTIFSFHTLEHLPDPLKTLGELIGKLSPGGRLIVEVPHANDFLLWDDLDCTAFKSFTLWSQHLVLHTRHSLSTLLKTAGLKNISIEGVQRYPLSNHLHWLGHGRPGGHKSDLAMLDTDALTRAYESALSRIDATDTLVAVASVGGLPAITSF